MKWSKREERLTEFYTLWRNDHASLDVLLRQAMDTCTSKQMLAQLLADVPEEIHKYQRSCWRGLADVLSMSHLRVEPGHRRRVV